MSIFRDCFSGPICSYVLSSGDSDSDFPFHVELEEKKSGKATLKLKQGAELSCKRSPYRFTISAKPCDEENAPSKRYRKRTRTEDRQKQNTKHANYRNQSRALTHDRQIILSL